MKNLVSKPICSYSTENVQYGKSEDKKRQCKYYYAYNQEEGGKEKIKNGFFIEYREGHFLLIGYYRNNKKHGIFTEYLIQETKVNGLIYVDDELKNEFDVPFQ